MMLRTIFVLCVLSLVFSDECSKGNSWVSDLPSLPKGSGECAGAMIGDYMYFAGEANTDTYRYDFRHKKWDTVAKRVFPGNHHAAIVVNGYEWWLIGGIDAHSYGQVQVYDTKQDSWSLRAPVPWDGGSMCVALIDRVIYACGGVVGFHNGSKAGGTNTTNKCAKYHLDGNNKWESFKSMPEGRNHAAVTTDGKKMWVFGGRMGYNIPQNGFPNVQVYDPSNDEWTQHTKPMPVGRGGTGHAVWSDNHKRFYVFGGETENDPRATKNWVYNRTDIYDPEADTWSQGMDMPFARHGIFPILRDNEIHIVSGGWHHGYAISTNYQKYCLP